MFDLLGVSVLPSLLSFWLAQKYLLSWAEFRFTFHTQQASMAIVIIAAPTAANNVICGAFWLNWVVTLAILTVASIAFFMRPKPVDDAKRLLTGFLKLMAKSEPGIPA